MSSIYQVRDTAYDRISAIRGKIEKVVIKKVITSTEEYLNGSEEYYSYVDTFNSVHLEGDLISYEAAAKLTGVIYFIGGCECSGIADNSVV
jgi:hypothetical protein